MRIVLFLATNIAVLAVLSVVCRVLGVDQMLVNSSGGMNLTYLLIMAGVFGMGGSFISLAMVLPAIRTTLTRSAPIVALVKPQFEAGKGRTDKGVVRDPAIHREVLAAVVAAAGGDRLGTRAVIASPILGPEGNREFLVHLAAGPSCAEIDERIAEATAPLAGPVTAP